jgi:hypothetical protein
MIISRLLPCMKTFNLFNRVLISSVAILALTHCPGGGGSISGTGGTITGTITINKAYPTSAGPSWTPITFGGRYFIKGLSVTISGICARGIAAVEVNDGVTTFPPINCSNAAFSFSHTYTAPEEGDKTVTINGLDMTNTPIGGVTSSVNIRIDNTAPNAPVVTTNGGANYAVNSAALTVNGTDDVDTQSVTSSSSGTVTAAPGSGTFSQNATLNPGETRIFTFTAWDLAGNASNPTTFTVSFLGTRELILSNLSSTGNIGTVTSTGTTREMRASTVAPIGSTSSQLTSATTNLKKSLGLSNISSRDP